MFESEKYGFEEQEREASGSRISSSGSQLGLPHPSLCEAVAGFGSESLYLRNAVLLEQSGVLGYLESVVLGEPRARSREDHGPMENEETLVAMARAILLSGRGSGWAVRVEG